MKKIFTVILLLSIYINGGAQNRNNIICRLGFTYEISQNNHWGKDKLVINSIYPYSSAELAGLKPYDVIEAIDGIAVTDVTEDDVTQLLNPADKNEVLLTVYSIGSNEKQEIKVYKECKKANTITEEQLAIAFNMYSLETTSERQFICPFRTTTTDDNIDFGAFKTFAFAPIDANNQTLETTINGYLQKELTQKGLLLDTQAPDILVQTFYYFDKNPNYRGANQVLVEKEAIFRYDLSYNRMEKLPFLSPQAAESEAAYFLQLGIRLIDQKYIFDRVLWECEASELLETAYRLEDYARIHIPLMCMQYPYVKYTKNVPFTVKKKSYNYTGIQYDIDRLEQVVEVDRNSPAYAAGVRPQDIVERIGRHRMDRSAGAFTKSYKQFISHTMQFRDPKTMFTDANGFKHCMLWDTFKYTQIADAVQQADYLSAFSYLYNFAPYINPSGNNVCIFQIKRGKEKKEITIRPTIRAEVNIEIK